jgi:mRNA interferase MazF
VTSKAYGDPSAIRLNAPDFSFGSLHMTSYARPGKLFTANQSIIVAEVASLSPAAYVRMIDAVIATLRPTTTP